MPKYKYPVEELERMSKCPWLTDRERRVFELFYRRGWQIEDIAAELEIERSTVSRDLRSVRQKCHINAT